MRSIFAVAMLIPLTGCYDYCTVRVTEPSNNTVTPVIIKQRGDYCKVEMRGDTTFIVLNR